MFRKLIAGILGGIVYFAWSTLAHTMLPLGEMGVREMPNEEAVVTAMQGLPGHGLYLFPGTGLPANATRAQKNAVMDQHFQKVATSPSGLLVYHPTRPVSFPRMMGTEAATNILQLLLVAFLLGQASLSSFSARWGFVTVAGILAGISTNVSYWNWYGFPTTYTLAYAFTVVAGFVIAGLVVAAIVRPAEEMLSILPKTQARRSMAG
jgi:hypothetical protein